MATLEDPSEDNGYAVCNDCGEKFPYLYEGYPEDAEITAGVVDDGPDPFDDLPELPDFPELTTDDVTGMNWFFAG